MILLSLTVSRLWKKRKVFDFYQIVLLKISKVIILMFSLNNYKNLKKIFWKKSLIFLKYQEIFVYLASLNLNLFFCCLNSK